jgi:hypothetical protein
MDIITPQNTIECLKMDLEGSRPQFSKLGPATKMTLQADSSNLFSTLKATRWMKNNIIIQSGSLSLYFFVVIKFEMMFLPY